MNLGFTLLERDIFDIEYGAAVIGFFVFQKRTARGIGKMRRVNVVLIVHMVVVRKGLGRIGELGGGQYSGVSPVSMSKGA